MLTDTLLANTEREARAILAAVRSDPAAPVAACPGWDTTDLLVHVGRVHRFVTDVLTNRRTNPPERRPADDPGPEPWDWYHAGLAALVEALGDIGPSEPVWSWTNRRNGGFYHRRMVHEHTIHRWDAQASTGVAAHIDADVATDGVNEILAVGLRYRGNGRPVDYPGSSVLLVRTDGADRWLIRAMDGTLVVARDGDAGTRADAVLTGPAEDLYLHLWGRRTPSLSVSGERDAATAWGSVAP